MKMENKTSGIANTLRLVWNIAYSVLIYFLYFIMKNDEEHTIEYIFEYWYHVLKAAYWGFLGKFWAIDKCQSSS